MPRNNTGTFGRVNNSFSEPVDGTIISEIDANLLWSDYDDGLTDSLSRSGKGAMLTDLNVGGFKATNLANGVAATDALNLGQATSVVSPWAIAAGSADALTATYSPAITLTDGQIAYVRAISANATTTPTFSPNGLTAHTITKYGGNALLPGDIQSLAGMILRYNLANTQWEFLNPSIPGGSLVQAAVAKTTAFSIFTADSGKTFACGGSASYTITVGAVAGFATNFFVTIYNNDTRGKLMSINGITVFYLWPGQTLQLRIAAGAWIMSPSSQRFRTLTQPTLYIDSVNGNDANDGLAAGSGNALRAIQTGINFVYSTMDAAGNSYMIQLATGTYTENILCKAQPLGIHFITILGATGSPASYLITAATASDVVTITDRGCLVISGVSLGRTGAGTTGVVCTQMGLCDFDHTTFGSFDSGVVMNFSKIGRGNMGINVTISGNAATFLQMSQGGSFEWGATAFNLTGSPAFTTFALMQDSGTNCTVDAGASFTGTAATGTRHSVAVNASLTTNTVSFPGSIAGGTATGGQVV